MSISGGKLAYGLPPDIARLLYNNDPRVDYQVAEIKNSLGIARSLKSDLSFEVTQLRMELMRLEREELHAARHIERCEFALAPIRRIPTEILEHIFLHYADLLGDKPDCVDVKGGVWVLGHICSYWRAVALSTPEIWTRCAFSCDIRCRDAPALVEAWFKRAGNRRLAIRFWCRAPDAAPVDNGHSPCDKVLRMFKDHRWSDAELQGSPRFFDMVETGRNNFRSLQKLDIRVVVSGNTVHLVTLSTFSAAPRLHDVSLSLTGSGVLGASLPWNQLVAYKGPIYLNADAHILHHAPNIVECTFYPANFHWTSTNSNQALVHRLQHLHLTRFSPPPDALTLPALQSLRFSACDDVMLPSIDRLLQRSMGAPTSLHIDEFILSPALVALLAAAPTVTDLTIECEARLSSVASADDFFAFFKEDGSTSPLLPAMRRLTTRGLAFGESMVRMLEARCAPPGQKGNTQWEGARLESLTISEVRNTHISHLLRIKRLESGAGLKLAAESLSAVRILPSN
ncbi:hypothetical protein DFH07DRAFT_839085 [Mycena maculata]|uniref:F-box domain-containing protein n=1 Tax=Mycena maculata TaxID=230809 RepID=A0AAD7ID83_9AGAR|nr:hypothetical protein DFH07DRAFT_839085 [Mycena maculata]